MSFIKEVEHLQIPIQDILLATKSFAEENFIGQGGFGRVYQGQYEPHGTVAIKRLDRKGCQGEREFVMEIAMLSCYRHENLVSLIGFCSESDEKLLVYKHESKGSLDKFLSSKDLTWIQRLRICLGAACGLKYLHHDAGPQHRVLHRDIKSSNILLDKNWKAKISDFGLSKIGPANVQFTFLFSNVCGTFGYVDPLYLETGILTKKSDVYSFGVVLFEVLCGRLVCMQEYHDERRFLVKLAQRHFEKQTLDEIIDPNLRKQMTSASLGTFSTIAYQCLEKLREERPTMSQVVESLEKALDYQINPQLQFMTRVENFGAVQTGDRFTTPLNGSYVTSKRRELGVRTSEPLKRNRLTNTELMLILDDLDKEHVIKTEIAKITDKGSLVDFEGVKKLIQLMQPGSVKEKVDLTCRIMLVEVISVTDKLDCLGQFVQLRGLLVLDEWLQEVNKGKINDKLISPEDEKSVEELLIVLLRALDKLPVNLHALQTCNVWRSVNHLRTHNNLQIQKKARSLVGTWKKRVEAEMNSNAANGRGIAWPSKP